MVERFNGRIEISHPDAIHLSKSSERIATQIQSTLQSSYRAKITRPYQSNTGLEKL